MKIRGNTVGTPIKPEKVIEKAGGGGSVELDTTLTVEGKAADAKAVGDAIKVSIDSIVRADGYYSSKGTWTNSDSWTTEEFNILGLDGIEIEVKTFHDTTRPIVVFDANFVVLETYVSKTGGNPNNQSTHTVTIPDEAAYLEIPYYGAKYCLVSDIAVSASVKSAHKRIDGFDNLGITVDGLEKEVGLVNSMFNRTYNLLDPNTCVAGYLSIKGNVVESAAFFISDYIPISVDDVFIRTTADMYSCAFYGANKDFISYNDDGQKSVSIPTDAVYVRITFNSYLTNASRYCVYVGNEEKTYIPYQVIGRQYIEKDTESFPDVSLVMTKDLYIAHGVKVDIHAQSITKGINVDKTVRPIISSNGMYRVYDKHIEITGGERADCQTGINCETKWGKYVGAKVNIHNVPANAGSGQNKKVLFIGDSKTDAGIYTQCLLDMFANDPMSIRLLGTRGNTETNRHEGRSGWSAEFYCENNAWRGVVDENGKFPDSPFFNPTTQSFDFAYYMAQNGYSDVDYVFINLGTNDTASNFISYYHEMIDSIRAYNSNIAIGLWVPAPFATFGGYTHSTNDNQTFAMMEAVIAEFDTDGNKANKIFVVPTHMNLNTEYDYPWKDVPYTNTKPEQTYRVCTDQIHEVNGYYKDANVIFGYIKHFATLT